jgi:hypothetical protein
MNKLKTMLCAFCTLVLVNVGTTVTAVADSSGFAGPYVGFQILAAGIEMDGKSRETGGLPATGNKDTDELQAGKAAAIAGWEVGYAVPIGSMFLLDIGASFLSGEAKIETLTDNPAARGNVSFKVDDVKTIYISPTLALSETSSLYAKIGLSEADVGVSGDITTPANLSGTNLALGTRSVLSSGIFIRTEAGMIDYNGISAHGKGGATNAIKKTTSYSADPTVAYGSISLGMRF